MTGSVKSVFKIKTERVKAWLYLNDRHERLGMSCKIIPGQV